MLQPKALLNPFHRCSSCRAVGATSWQGGESPGKGRPKHKERFQVFACAMSSRCREQKLLGTLRLLVSQPVPPLADAAEMGEPAGQRVSIAGGYDVHGVETASLLGNKPAYICLCTRH